MPEMIAEVESIIHKEKWTTPEMSMRKVPEPDNITNVMVVAAGDTSPHLLAL